MTHEFNPDEIPVTSHGFFQSCIALMGASNLAEVLGMSTSTAYKQGEDPDLVAQPVRNRLDHIRAIFRRLENIGRTDVAISGLKYLADSVGMRVVPKTTHIPDKPTLEAELLDDLEPLAAMHRAMTEGRALVEVERLAEAVIDEIGQDLEKYKEKITDASQL